MIFNKKNTIFIIIFLIISFPVSAVSQPMDSDKIQEMIQAFKKDPRGPFRSIQWFCKDGTINPARQPCIDQEGNQHALHKKPVITLAQNQGIYLGQILTGTSFNDFVDLSNQNSRLKQYILEKYLQSIDDGWILCKARYYRGAVQMEDEEEWGLHFLKKFLSRKKNIKSQFFLARQAVKEIPHRSKKKLWSSIRADSKTLAQLYRSFDYLRVKIHGKPQAHDIEKIIDFKKQHKDKMSAKELKILDQLVSRLKTAFSPSCISKLKSYIPKLHNSLSVKKQLKEFIKNFENKKENSPEILILRCSASADLLLNIRTSLMNIKSSRTCLRLMDLSNDLESILFKDAAQWQPKTLRELLKKNYILAKALTGTGFIELWEWDTIKQVLEIPNKSDKNKNRISFKDLIKKTDYCRRISQWGTGMVNAVYNREIKIFSEFEPLAKGFADDRIRSSLLLPMGELAGQLADITAELSGISNHVMNIKDQNRIQGLNPGFALGELEVISDWKKEISFSDKKIYVLSHVPADIKPVAGIASVSEGNLVSHVQLLARNLGIPNSVIAPHHIKSLIHFSGQNVFYAVSPMGTVIMKPAAQMSPREIALTQKAEKSTQRVMVPLDKLNLDNINLISLKNLRASDSGIVCGPKAANLGQLKNLFPENVVDGLVIPFGVFRKHMEQIIPKTNITYWQFLQKTFSKAEADRQAGKAEQDIDTYVLERLTVFRKYMSRISFLPKFKREFPKKFKQEFGVKLGKLAVFIRSDTNMEDLKEFTGSGLNKTVFNVRNKKKIWQGIRTVWASPFRERGYRWRQKFLLNPENVYPSILILPTVNVDKSGVLITTGLSSRNPEDITIAFSKGPGGAVEGQAAETYLLKSDKTIRFLSPSREPKYNVLFKKGGGKKGYKHFNKPILNPDELEKLWNFAQEIKTKLPGTPGIETRGPFDVELGFLGKKIWLFQVRPFVENKLAKASAYLQNLDPEYPDNIDILLDSEYKISKNLLINK